MEVKGKQPMIGLTWEPKLPLLSSSSNNKSHSMIEGPESSYSSNNNALWNSNSELVDGLFVPPNDPKKLDAHFFLLTKGFDMPATTATPELKKDLLLLKLRSVMYPKRHYKKGSSKTLPKYFQVGSVIESSTDFFSGRLTKKERKLSIANELLSNDTHKAYRKSKVREIEERNRPAGNEKWKTKGRHSQKCAKQSRH